MKLGGVHAGTVYAMRNRTIGIWDPATGYTPRGQLPNPETGIGRLRFTSFHNRRIQQFLRPLIGTYTTGNVWPVGNGCVLATTRHWVYFSSDGGRSWRAVHRLPASSGPMGVLPTSLAQREKRLLLAEYPLDGEEARILISEDAGRTWKPYLTQSDICHFHGIFTDPYSTKIWATAGDSNAHSAIGTIDSNGFTPIGSGSQQWRAVDLAFTPTSIVWGMDCPYASRVNIYQLNRDQLHSTDPTPEVIGSTDRSIYYATYISGKNEEWIVVSTAAETGAIVAREQHRSPGPAVLCAAASDGYRHWNVLYQFSRGQAIADYVPSIPSAGAYAYLETHPTLGLLINPFNTAEHNGELLSIPTNRLPIGQPDFDPLPAQTPMISPEANR